MLPISTLAEPAGDAAITPVQALPAGHRVGEYHVLRVLQQDEQGIAYLARDLLLQRDLTLHEHLPSELAYRGAGEQVVLRAPTDATAFAASQKDFVERMQRQARFDHPAIAAVWRCWTANGTAYAALEHPDGVTLKQARQAMGGAPQEAWIRSVAMPLLDALETMHAASVLHLGITPTQIMLRTDGRAQISTFGSVGQASAADAPLRAPELRRPSDNLPLGAWTDLHALGALLYDLIMGHAPPLREPVGAAFASAARHTATAAGPLGQALAARRGVGPKPAYSMALLRTIDRALAPWPGERPQSVAQFRSALDDHSGAVSPVAVALAQAGLSPKMTASGPRAQRAVGAMPAATPTPSQSRSAPTSEPPELSLAMAVDAPPPTPPFYADHAPARTRRPTRHGSLLAGLALLATLGLAGLVYWLQAGVEVQALRAPPGGANAAAPRGGEKTRERPFVFSRDPFIGSQGPTSSTAVGASPLSQTASPTTATPAATQQPAARARSQVETPVPAPDPADASAPSPAATANAAQRVAPASPRAACAGRSNFSLLYCMQQQCEQPRFVDHPQCRSLRERDDIVE